MSQLGGGDALERSLVDAVPRAARPPTERVRQRVPPSGRSRDLTPDAPPVRAMARAEVLSPAVMAGVVESAPDGVLLCDEDGTIVLANRQMELMFGHPRAALVGQPVETLIPMRDRGIHHDHRARFAAGPVTRTMATGRSVFGLRHDGSEFPVEVGLSPLETTEGRFIIARVRDVTEKVAADLRHVEAAQDLAVLEDRQRIARDLHDRVIQRLFVAGMSLQSIVGLAADEAEREGLRRMAEEIDSAILDLRSSVFELASHASGDSLRRQVLELCAEMRPALGMMPRVHFSGPVETVDAGAGDTVLPVLREALANIARHAHATNVVVTVTANAGLRLVVEDDGVGVDERRQGGGEGMGNMASRAKRLGGSFVVGPGAESGTRLEWHVPGE